ncbi:MAG TPA: hypothetical protein VI279_16050, partial [Rhodocyclaceae bacterium]
SGLPPLVREKDQFQALLTLRNGTAKTMQVSVHARLGDKELETREVRLDAEGAAELSWSGTAPENATKLTWEFSAEDNNGSARDLLRITQQVAPAVPVTVQQASFSRIEGRYEIAATQPAGALPGRGGIEVALSPKISAIPPGVTRYFEQYPFGCLEQRSSIAVGLHDPKRWQTVVDSLPAYLDNEGLARYFPGDSVTNNAGSVALTAYLLDISREAGFALPDDARNRMLQGLTRFVEGRLKREPRPYRSPAEDLLANKLTALEALTRAGATTTSASAAAAALAVEPLRLPTSALIDWSLVLRRLADLPQRSTQLAAAERELRNRLSYSGGRLAFSSERSDFWWWMMVSGDYNAFRLIDAVIDEPSWQADLPALVLGAVQRQARGRWFTTTANAWAVIALDKFGRKFEKEPVRGTTKATLVDSVRPERSAQREVEGRALGTNVPSTTTVRPEPFDKAQDRPVEGRAPGQTYTWKGASEEAPRLALAWPTKPADSKLSITHEGPGKPWANIQVLAAVPVTEPRAFGYRITRSVTPLQEKEKGKVTRGDLWRVMLDIEANQDMDWVVVSDPIPAGARILGDGDGRDSHIAQLSEDHRNDRLWPTFVERTFEGLRAYYEVVPRGHFKYEYTVRINNAGEFTLPATRVEAMYAPDVFGEAPNGKVVVGN